MSFKQLCHLLFGINRYIDLRMRSIVNLQLFCLLKHWHNTVCIHITEMDCTVFPYMYNVHTYARPYLCQSPVKSIQKLSIELMPQHCITLVPTVDKALDKSFR